MKKKNQKRIILAVGVVILLACLMSSTVIGKRPFKDLKATDISTASVWAVAPVEELPIEDKEALAACLQKVVIYQKVLFFDVLDGGNGPAYVLEMEDGTTIKITPNNGHLLIDDVRYRTNSETYEMLCTFDDEVQEN